MAIPTSDPERSLRQLAAELSLRPGLIAAGVREVRRSVPGYASFLVEQGERVEPTLMALTAVFCGACRGEELPEVLPEVLRDLGRRRSRQGLILDLSLEAISAQRRVMLETILRRSRRGFGGEDVVILAQERLSRAQEAITLELARGYVEGMGERFREQRAELQVLITIGRAVNESLEVDEVAAAALGETARAVRMEVGALWAMTGLDSAPVLAASYGADGRELEVLDPGGRPLSALIGQALSCPGPIQGGLPAVAGLPAAPYNLVAVALRRRQEVLGVMVLGTREDRRLSDSETAFVAHIAEQVSIALEHARQHRLEARTDYLTGLVNRPEFDRAIVREVASARRHRRSFSILLMDLDRLKKINDGHGHHIGDEAIRAVAEALRKVVRVGDICARLGGDEFALAMPEAEVARADEVAARIGGALADINRSGRLPVALQLSFGAAGWHPGLSARGLFELADRALYADKRRGQARRRYHAGREPTRPAL
ncbi:MAG: diguanylate cyclase domain-containing protein [Candidatus Dormibacteraceae bacterium]